MKPILEIQNISKKFKIYHDSSPYLSLRESFTSIFKRSKIKKETFWALKDITLDITPGESIGIIGRNGAGKSTLLKILSKITPPTIGKIISRGRIASLLEVGTGFHPELTGRENIFLNGSILGMKRNEIISKFDEIVQFSGTEQFLDTPLKHYSSGMQLRLAFSVAAFLEPEILVVDEVLAVGDAEFQKKCLGKMDEVSKSGRTILFVSHNMAAVKNLCSRGIVLLNGNLIADAKVESAIETYIKNTDTQNASFEFKDNNNLFGIPTELVIENSDHLPTTVLKIGEVWHIKVSFTIRTKVPHFIIGIGFKTIDDIPVRTTWSKPVDLSPGNYKVVFTEDNIVMAQGKYKLIIGMSSKEQTFYYAQDCAVIEFESYSDKTIAISSSAGLFLNQMKVELFPN